MRDRRPSVPPGDRAFHAYLTTVASAVIPIVLTAVDLAEIARQHGREVTELSPSDLREELVDRAHDKTPTLGVCCTGGRFAGEASLELGDVWETADERPDVTTSLDCVLRELGDDDVHREVS